TALRAVVGELPLPANAGVIVDAVAQRRLVTEIAEQIVVDRPGEAAGDRARLRVVSRIGPDLLGLGTEIARIDAPDDLPTIAQQLAPEALWVDAQIGAQNI